MDIMALYLEKCHKLAPSSLVGGPSGSRERILKDGIKPWGKPNDFFNIKTGAILFAHRFT